MELFQSRLPRASTLAYKELRQTVSKLDATGQPALPAQDYESVAVALQKIMDNATTELFGGVDESTAELFGTFA